MIRRQGERRNPWSRRLSERRKEDLDVENDKRKDDRRKFDQRNHTANAKRGTD